MAKFTIIYRRTIQTKDYHTSTIGLSQEFDTADHGFLASFERVKEYVDRWVDEERKRLAHER